MKQKLFFIAAVTFIPLFLGVSPSSYSASAPISPGIKVGFIDYTRIIEKSKPGIIAAAELKVFTDSKKETLKKINNKKDRDFSRKIVRLEIEKFRTAVLSKMTKAVEGAIKKYGKDNKYTMIKATSSIAYYDKSLDITDKIIRVLAE